MTTGKSACRLRKNGFSLVELMIVLVIIGVLAAIAIPNMLDAKTRAQQRSSVAELRNWGNGLGAYMAEVGIVPPGGGGPVPASTIHNDLVPYAVSALHDQDAWKHDILYLALNSNTGTSYTVVSGGRDGIFDPSYTECVGPGTWFIYNYDLVLADGLFICSPS
jgi:prepilin-type N-terminal cleavage/methylation domain-containing protein